MCLPSPTNHSTLPTEIWQPEFLPGNVSSPLAPYATFLELLDIIGNIDTVEDAILFGRPAYKQIKYAGPFSIFEYGADTALQVYDDWEKDLFFHQRFARAGIRGLESAATDAVSIPAGGFVGGVLQANVPIPLVPVGVGYLMGASAASSVVDNFFVHKVNPWLFSFDFFGGVE